MGESTEICVPDIGDFEDVEVVEILVSAGDRVELEDPVVSIESDKATMEIPATAAGVVLEVCVKEGDSVSEGTRLVRLESEEGTAAADTDSAPDADRGEEDSGAALETSSAAEAPSAPPSRAPSSSAEAGEAPSTPTGNGHVGDDASEEVEAEQGALSAAIDAGAVVANRAIPMSTAAANPVPDRAGHHHASPLVRRYARELGVPLEDAQGSGPKGRILVDDLKATVRERFAADGEAASKGAGTGAGIPAMPAVDFSAFGPVHESPLSRIQKVSGPSLHRSWLNVPHVTQHDEADVTELERFRAERREDAAERGLKLSPLLFVMKAMVVALREFPTFRASLAPEGDRLIVKDFFHLGIAVDTDQGLVVPVIRDVDQKGVFELAAEVNETAERARNKKLKPDDLRGAVTTISSLGGIGGRAFSPIVNAPEVAILGLSNTRVQPVWRGPSPVVADAEADEGRFEPRLVMPISLSYDHRVIDGAEAVRFTTRLAEILADPMLLLL